MTRPVSMLQSTRDLFSTSKASLGGIGLPLSHNKEQKLLNAARNGSIETLREILESKKADVDFAGANLRTPLHEAVRKGHAVCALLLLDWGASVNARDKNDQTPLHYAVRGDFPDCVKLLIQYGANPNLRNLQHGDTPLHLAAESGLLRCLQELLGDGDAAASEAKPKKASNRRFSNFSIDQIARGAPTRLAVDFDIRNDMGNTSLHVCSTGRGAWTKKNRLCCALLLSRGALFLVNSRNNAGETPLHVAAKWGSFGCAVLLLESGASPTVRDNEQNQPVHLILKELVLDYTIPPHVIRDLRQKLKNVLDTEAQTEAIRKSQSLDNFGAMGEMDDDSLDMLTDVRSRAPRKDTSRDIQSYRSSLQLSPGDWREGSGLMPLPSSEQRGGRGSRITFDTTGHVEGGRVRSASESKSLRKSTSTPVGLAEILQGDEEDDEVREKAEKARKRINKEKEESYFEREEAKTKEAYKRKVKMSSRTGSGGSIDEIRVQVVFPVPIPPLMHKRKYFMISTKDKVRDAKCTIAEREQVNCVDIYGLFLPANEKRCRSEGIWMDDDECISTYALIDKDKVHFKEQPTDTLPSDTANLSGDLARTSCIDIPKPKGARSRSAHRRAASWTPDALDKLKEEEALHQNSEEPEELLTESLELSVESAMLDNRVKIRSKTAVRGEGAEKSSKKRKKSSSKSKAVTVTEEELEHMVQERVDRAIAPMHNKLCRLMNRMSLHDDNSALELPLAPTGARPEDAPATTGGMLWVPRTLGELRWMKSVQERDDPRLRERRMDMLISFYKIRVERTPQMREAEPAQVKHAAIWDFFVFKQ